MRKICIALDWTANTNHTGFFVAQEMGFYKELNLEVTIKTPATDNYAVTPAKKVELGEADLALCPFESILSYRTKKKPFDAVALATLFQEDLSAIVCLESSGLKTPKELDQHTYASYKARYEDEIVRQMIKNDGGTGVFSISYPEKLGIWDTLLSKAADATWIFMNWEGIHAENKGVRLNSFRMADYGIPYGYSPVIMASERKAEKDSALYTDFLAATKKGFLYCSEDPLKAVAILKPHVSEKERDLDLLQSQRYTSPYYGNAANWGRMEKKRVTKFLDWLFEKDLEKRHFCYEEVVKLL